MHYKVSSHTRSGSTNIRTLIRGEPVVYDEIDSRLENTRLTAVAINADPSCRSVKTSLDTRRIHNGRDNEGSRYKREGPLVGMDSFISICFEVVHLLFEEDDLPQVCSTRLQPNL